MEEKTKRYRLSITWKIVVWVSILAVLILIILLAQYKWVAQNDKNGDGKVDEWSRFSLSGQPIEFKRDKDFDGRVDYIEKYEKGILAYVQIDYDYDGYFETKGTYNITTEKLVKLERDSNKDGWPERQTLYDANTGLPIVTEIDTDNDRSYDKFFKGKKGEKDE